MAHQPTVAALKRRIAEMEHGGSPPRSAPGGAGPSTGVLTFGCPELEAAFTGGGLPRAGAHEISGPSGAGAAPGFALGLLARLFEQENGARALLVQEGMAAREGGSFYGPGLQAYGVDPARCLVVQVRRATEVLWAVEEACRSGAVAAVLADLWDGTGLDLQATRRFNLAGRRTATLALLVTRDLGRTSAALTRWRVAGRASRVAPEVAGDLLGRPAFDLTLIRNRQGRTGAWTAEWSPNDRVFLEAPHPVALASPAADRPLGQAGAVSFSFRRRGGEPAGPLGQGERIRAVR